MSIYGHTFYHAKLSLVSTRENCLNGFYNKRNAAVFMSSLQHLFELIYFSAVWRYLSDGNLWRFSLQEMMAKLNIVNALSGFSGTNTRDKARF